MTEPRGLRDGDDVAWAAGYADHYHGRPLAECPYHGDDAKIEAYRWEKGWRFAEQESRT